MMSVNAVRSDSAKPLAIAFRALLVVRGVTCLVEAGDEGYAENGDRINGDLERKLELELCCHRRRIWIVIDIEVREYTQDALLLLRRNLFRSDPYRGITHIDRCLYFFKLECTVREQLILACPENYWCGGPVCKALSMDCDSKRHSGLDIAQFKETIVAGKTSVGVMRRRTLQDHPCTRNSAAIRIHHGSRDASCLLFWGCDVLSRRRTSQGKRHQ